MAKEGERAPANTIFGRILVGVAVAAISGLLGTLGGFIIARDRPPAAEISPPGLTASADEVIQFTAAASRDPENRSLTYAWSVGGTRLDESPVARCSARGSLAECRFLVPGTFGVVVTATDEGGLSDGRAISTSSSISAKRRRCPTAALNFANCGRDSFLRKRTRPSAAAR